MTKVELSTKLKQVRKRITELKEKEAPVYVTGNKYIPSHGYVADIPTLRECAKALATVKKAFSTESEEATELGLTDADIAAETNYLGFKLTAWQKDIQNRVTELKDADMLVKLENAEATLSKHRTADDIFNEDVESIGDVLDSLV